MIYFSDLDRTLICSNKLIKNNEDAICIEYINNEPISYISEEIINKLQNLNSSTIFIPTTTRSIEQFNRINFTKFGLKFKYSITSNGACILKDGEILESWKKQIDDLKRNVTSLNDMVQIYNNKYKNDINPYITKFRIVEDNFFYIVLNKDIVEISFLEDYIEFLRSCGWTYFKNCSKVYFLPNGMTKENAIQFLLKNELKESIFNALGDSSMDTGMLSISNKAYIPKHGDISSTFKHNNLYISKDSGLKGINEILENILLEEKEIL